MAQTLIIAQSSLSFRLISPQQLSLGRPILIRCIALIWGWMSNLSASQLKASRFPLIHGLNQYCTEEECTGWPVPVQNWNRSGSYKRPKFWMLHMNHLLINVRLWIGVWLHLLHKYKEFLQHVLNKDIPSKHLCVAGIHTNIEGTHRKGQIVFVLSSNIWNLNYLVCLFLNKVLLASKHVVIDVLLFFVSNRTSF